VQVIDRIGAIQADVHDFFVSQMDAVASQGVRAMLRKTMIVLAMAAALTGGLTADAFARGGGGGGGHGGFGGGGFGGGHMGGGFGGAHMGGGFGGARMGGGLEAAPDLRATLEVDSAVLVLAADLAAALPVRILP
jgi:hypothetical protein